MRLTKIGSPEPNAPALAHACAFDRLRGDVLEPTAEALLDEHHRAAGGAQELDGVERAKAKVRKHHIKAVDRLLGNRHLHRERHGIYHELARTVLGGVARPAILVDLADSALAHKQHRSLAISLPLLPLRSGLPPGHSGPTTFGAGTIIERPERNPISALRSFVRIP